MKPAECIECKNFPCSDINNSGYLVPAVEIDPGKVKVIMISEASPENPHDYFYASGDPFYLKTTLQAFSDAGVSVNSIQEILDLGFYLTTAVKCSKTQYGISAQTVKKTALWCLRRNLPCFQMLRYIC
ncbi:hypothetical protein [Methanosarcina horonobensis]|uniref:hypothetical protein n=1 Tax=Methanosarcina horonobensis TaxID=418008 RepID=UPI0022B93AD7|nr:hypothetical protein [Methanosarcina horonobensis]